MDGYIVNIQRFSIHDGPGIRSTVFLKGCSLHCFWCHNPESIGLKPDLQFYPERCIGCGRCVEACPNGVHAIEDGRRVLRRERCQRCGLCTETCYAQALTLAGRRVSVEEVMEEVRKDSEFYRTSGGGVTLSGGDPCVQPEFSHAILAACHAEGIGTCVETAANCRWEDLAMVLSETDLVLLDVKHMDPIKHREATGVSNERIQANIRRLSELGLPFVPRVPVVPGVNDTPEEIGAIARFVAGLSGAQHLVLLPFHRLGEGKYRSLGLEYRASTLAAPTREHMESLAAEARRYGIEVRVG